MLTNGNGAMQRTLFFACAVALFALTISPCVAADDWVRFSPDSHQVVVEAENAPSFQGIFSADFREGDKEQSVSSKDGGKIEAVADSTVATPFGDAVISSRTFGGEQSPFRYTLVLKHLKSMRAFTLQAVFHNDSDHDIRLHHFDLLDTRAPDGAFTVADAANWLVTPLMESAVTAPAMPLPQMNRTVHEAALLSRPDDSALLIGPVGPAEAYTEVDVRDGSIRAIVDMDDVLVAAGQSRRSEEMVFALEPSSAAVALWTRWVAITHGARLNKGRSYGWCSWYDRTTRIDGSFISGVIQTIAENPNVFGKGVIQIDDGYQKMDGDWSGNAKFPGGMEAVARHIRDSGCVPGIWIAPLTLSPKHPFVQANPEALQTTAQGIAYLSNPNQFHPDGGRWLDPSHPKSREFLRQVILDACARGFTYLKIDFNGIGSRFFDPTKTRLQVYRELYALYREAAGDQTYIVACLGAPNRGVIGYADAARVGPDSHPAVFERCLKSVLRFQIYNQVWWHNDPDVSYLAQKLASRKLGPTPQGQGMWRTWHDINSLVGGTAMISEPIDQPDAREVWRNFEIMRPSSREPARLLNLGRVSEDAVFGFFAARPYGNFAVYNLYNSGTQKTPVTLDFKAAGLPTGPKCAVFDFWENRVIGYATDSYTSAPLDPHASVLLRFTPIIDGTPTVVGSNLHLSIGATEIDELRVAPATVEIQLNGDAGAEKGSLTFHSDKPLAAASAENCKVTSVEDLGDGLWQVNLNARQWAKTQSIVLNRSP
jgi:alpha-galactosidase